MTSSFQTASLTTSHRAQLTGLAPNTTYYYRISSTDAFGNTGRWPASGAPVVSFTMPTAAATDTTVARFRCGHAGRRHVRVELRRRRGHAGAARGRRVRRHRCPLGVDDRGVDRRDDDVPRRRRIRRRLLAANRHVRRLRPSARILRHLQRSSVPERRLRGHARRRGRVVGDVRHEPDHGHAAGPHPERRRQRRRRRPRLRSTSVPSTCSGSSGTPPCASTSTAASSTPQPPSAARCDRSPATTPPAGAASSLKWMRMTPFASSGSFLSRVHDAGATSEWGVLGYTASVPRARPWHWTCERVTRPSRAALGRRSRRSRPARTCPDRAGTCSTARGSPRATATSRQRSTR